MEKTILLLIAATIFSWSAAIRKAPKVAQQQATENSTSAAQRLSIEHLIVCKGYNCTHYCN